MLEKDRTRDNKGLALLMGRWASALVVSGLSPFGCPQVLDDGWPSDPRMGTAQTSVGLWPSL